jgi:hypothetical protein
VKRYRQRKCNVTRNGIETPPEQIQIQRQNNKEKNKQKKKVSLAELSLDHIADWLAQKRTLGKYLTIDEQAQLEYFKNYCIANGRDAGRKAYTDFIRAFQNSFDWDNAQTKGEKNENTGRNNTTGKSRRAQQVVAEAFAESYGPGDSEDLGRLGHSKL